MPNARARLLAVVSIVAGSCAAVTGWFGVRRSAAGSIKTKPDPLKLNTIKSSLELVRENFDLEFHLNGKEMCKLNYLVKRTVDRAESRLRMAHCIDNGAKLLR